MAGRSGEALKFARRQIRLRPNRTIVYYQAHRAAVWSGRIEEARIYLARVRGSGLPQDNQRLAELRQACAEGRRTDAARIYASLLTSKRASTHFHAAQLIGDEAAATQALMPFDAPDRLPTLMQFVVYPTFDARAFPNLSARLAAGGATIVKPIAVPYGCRRAG